MRSRAPEREGTRRPARTCAGCRRRASRAELLRFVVDERGHLRLDPEGSARGRGVHLCPALPCLESALRTGGFARSLKRRVAAVEPGRFAAETRARLEQAARELEERALRDGRAGSSEAVVEPRARRRLELLRAQAGGLSAAG